MSEYIAVPLVGKLGQGKSAKVSPKDYELVNQYKWHFNGHYALARVNGEKNKTRMHRFIMNPPRDMEIDHIDLDKLNNTRENLRICTRAQNACNFGMTKRNTSGYCGVSFFKRDQRWAAHISTGGKLKHLGLFDSPQKASQAYEQAALELRGEYARLNNNAPIAEKVTPDHKVLSNVNTSGYRGVFRRPEGKFRAGIGYEKKMHHLGTFTDPIQAAKAYDEAARRIYGEKAILNFP